MILLTLAAISLFGFSVYNLSCAFLNVPTQKTSRMMMAMRRQRGAKGGNLLDVYITRIAAFAAPHMRMDKLQRDKMQSILDVAGIKMSPEVYTIRAWAAAGGMALCAIPVAFFAPPLVPVWLVLSVELGFSIYDTAFDFAQKHRRLIEAELLLFALTIKQHLENDRDVLKILTAYRCVAGKDFGMELDQTIADMKTGSYENALLRLEARVESPALSDVIRGLVEVIRGEDQRMYFKMVCFDMRQTEKSNLKEAAAKRSRKIRSCSRGMLLSITLMYLVALSTEILNLIGRFWG